MAFFSYHFSLKIREGEARVAWVQSGSSPKKNKEKEMRRKRLSLALVGAVALAVSANAAIIGVNFTQSAGHANEQIASSTEAGVWSTNNWNNTAGTAGTVSALLDSSGTPTTAAVTWNALGVYGDAVANTDANAGIGDGQLTRGYLDDGPVEYSPGVTNGVVFSVTNVPYATYSVVLLLSTDTPGSTYGPWVVNGNTNSTEGTKRQYRSPYQWNTNTCIVITGLTDSTLTAVGHFRINYDNVRGSISGFQIIDEATEGPQPPFTPALPPEWNEDPMQGADGTVGVAYSDISLADRVFDYNGDTITFSITNGPAWLSVASDGTLSGTPTGAAADVFTVVATDIDGSTEAVLNIEVAAPTATSVIAWNFSERWDTKMVQGDGVVFGTDQWTDSVDHAAPNSTVVANSTDPWAVTTPISASHVAVAWSSANMWNAGDEDAVLENQVFKMYLDDGGTGPLITVSGLSEWLAAQGANAYTVTFYRNSDTADNTFAEMDIYEGTGTGGTLLEALPPTLTDGSGSGIGSRLIQSATNSFSAGTVTFHTALPGYGSRDCRPRCR
jgi:hypothetical protein